VFIEITNRSDLYAVVGLCASRGGVRGIS